MAKARRNICLLALDKVDSVNVAMPQSPRPNRPATIRDVAALSGVSIATVTRTFQASPKVRPETSARVRESAKRLGYRPDSVAQALVTGLSRTIGVVIPSLVQSYWAEIADAIEARAAQRDYSVILASSRGDPARERAMLDMLSGKRVDGVIVGAVSGDPREWPLSARAGPLVLLEWDAEPQWDLLDELSEGITPSRLRRIADQTIAGEGLLHVSTDDTAGGALIARHLLQLGHEHVTFVIGPPVRPYLLRLLGAKLTLEGAGHRLEVVRADADSFNGGLAAAQEILGGGTRATAIVCCSDAIAVGVVRGARELGVEVPQELSITGYDDISVAAFVEPPLTTLRNPMRELGRLALDLALGSSVEMTASQRSLTGRLVVRDSSGPRSGASRP
jgi:LacI family transcriptional regulator